MGSCPLKHIPFPLLFNCFQPVPSLLPLSNFQKQRKEKENFLLLGMDSETNKTLPVSAPIKSEGKEKNGPAMTKQGAYAAISYMASAGQVHSSFLLNCLSFLFFFGFVSTYSLVDDKMRAKKKIWFQFLMVKRRRGCCWILFYWSRKSELKMGLRR